jgi:SAM-dependent methyltransferase
MNKKGAHVSPDDTIHRWYQEHANDFLDTDVIEVPFIGMSREAQDRLNRFKLWAVEHGGIVDLTGKHVLEFGAGHGRFALAFPQVASYLGVDFSQNLVTLGNLRIARAGLAERAKLVSGDVLTFNPQRRYDVVCSLGMMCYCPDPEPVIAAMARCLEPGGTLFFDFRNDSWLYSAIRRLKWLVNPPTGGVTYVAKAKQLERIFRRLGFDQVQFVSREFPLLAEHYARSRSTWPLRLRNAFASSALARGLATEAWVFAKRRR